MESAQYKKLKNARWTLLSNSENLSAVKSGHLKEILNSHISLATCYAMKEEMCRLYECDDIEGLKGVGKTGSQPQKKVEYRL